MIPGITITNAMMDLWNVENGRPLTASDVSAREFIDWLKATPADGMTWMPRYMQIAYVDSPELQKKFPEVAHGEISRFGWWARTIGRSQSSLIRLLGHGISTERAVREGGRIDGGVDVVGFLHAEHGIGQAARLVVEALRAVQTQVSTTSYRNTPSRQSYPFHSDEIGTYKTVIMAVNAEINKDIRNTFGEYFFSGTYVIGQWFWELEKAPKWFSDSYQYVNELWAPTRFIEEMLKREVPKGVAVQYMPLPLKVPQVNTTVTRSELGIDNRFMYLFTFDFMSVMKRKNPLGLVEAFRSTFTDGEGPQLVIKCINGKSRPEGIAQLLQACAGRSDITVIDKYLDADHAAALMNLCDCYVSLHRSEGLGLTIADAMLLEKPVIATGYSGNLDFMTPETSYLVPWEKVKVGRGAEGYDPSAHWADPDLLEAGNLMREVFENRVAAHQKGVAAKRDLVLRFSLNATGTRMSERLQEIWDSRKNDA
jgi:glycosyltransferase involved in cell wall biosynthesis